MFVVSCIVVYSLFWCCFGICNRLQVIALSLYFCKAVEWTTRHSFLLQSAVDVCYVAFILINALNICCYFSTGFWSCWITLLSFLLQWQILQSRLYRNTNQKPMKLFIWNWVSILLELGFGFVFLVIFRFLWNSVLRNVSNWFSG